MEKRIFLLSCDPEGENIQQKLLGYLLDVSPDLLIAGIKDGRIVSKITRAGGYGDHAKRVRRGLVNKLSTLLMLWHARNFIINTQQDLVVTIGSDKLLAYWGKSISGKNPKIIFAHLTSAASFCQKDSLLPMMLFAHSVFSGVPTDMMPSDASLASNNIYVGDVLIYDRLRELRGMEIKRSDSLIAISLGADGITVERNLPLVRNIIAALKSIDRDFSFLLVAPAGSRLAISKALRDVTGVRYYIRDSIADEKIAPCFAIMESGTDILGMICLGVPILVYRNLSFTDRLKEWLLGQETDYSDLINSLAGHRLLHKITNFDKVGGFLNPLSSVAQERFCKRIVAQFCRIFFYKHELLKQIECSRELLVRCSGQQSHPPMAMIVRELLSILKTQSCSSV